MQPPFSISRQSDNDQFQADVQRLIHHIYAQFSSIEQMYDFNAENIIKLPVIDHGDDVTGLADDDHPKYILHDGTRSFTGNIRTGDNWISNDGDSEGLLIETDGTVICTSTLRSSTATYRRYYHLPLAAFDPGASGATWVDPTIDTLGGFQLDAAGEILFAKVDVHADWDGASDFDVELYFECNIDNTGGTATDTVDMKAVVYYKNTGEAVNRTQTVEVATVIGACAQYTLFKVELPINWDEVDNVVLAGDQVTVCMNLETDTSEVDDIVITGASFYYHTTHVGIESGDT